MTTAGPDDRDVGDDHADLRSLVPLPTWSSAPGPDGLTAVELHLHDDLVVVFSLVASGP